MNAKKTLFSLGMALASSRFVQRITELEADDVFHLFGLQRRRGNTLSAVGLVAAGAAVGAGVALLFAPEAGTETRKRIGRQVEKLGQSASETVQQVVNELPGRAESHAHNQSGSHHTSHG
jgi:hypothetical protein